MADQSKRPKWNKNPTFCQTTTKPNIVITILFKSFNNKHVCYHQHESICSWTTLKIHYWNKLPSPTRVILFLHHSWQYCCMYRTIGWVELIKHATLGTTIFFRIRQSRSHHYLRCFNHISTACLCPVWKAHTCLPHLLTKDTKSNSIWY